MIVQNIHNVWDMVHNSYRNTVYTTLQDPKTNKKVVEVVQYIYNNNGKVTPNNTKGGNIDIQA